MSNLVENSNKDKVGNTFKKEERLCSKKIIDKLFADGKSIFVFPIKIVYLETPLKSKYKVQAAFTVPKRNFKKAVLRNLIRRRIREAYRLNKTTFYRELGEKRVAMFFIYTGKTISEYHEIERAIKKGLKKLTVEIDGKNL
jgi:ribonuclease P protein component